ncbi:MAG: insulinase family protein, partial [Gammaproteobacteria bacterium]|nr:insulinase family protein [Gammaproteobacteria bacterium]
DNPASPLVYKGVVFNEMKGAMSSAVQRIWQDMQSALFPTVTYHYNSGGEPAAIPDLTHQQLVDFHARHYQPSNATFMTYGSFPVEEHQQKMQELALEKYTRQDFDLRIPAEKRYPEPLTVSTRYALDEHDDKTPKSQILLGWLLGSVTDLDATMDAQMLSSALLDNSASPLRHALETTDLGSSPSDLCGLEESLSEAVFVCGLEGCRPEDAEKVQNLILSVISHVADNGVPQSQLEAILHQLELSQREVGGGHFPYGLQLMVKSLSPALHGADPFEVLDIEPVLERLRGKIRDPDYIPGLARRLLLDNQHRVLLTAEPDTGLAAEQNAAETARLVEMKKSLGKDDEQRILELTARLKQRQESEDDPELLPSVRVDDAPKDLKIPEPETLEIGATKASYFPTGTNGLVYQQVILEIPDIGEELLDDLPLFCDCLNEVGIRDLDYLQTQELQAAVTGGISARLSVRSPFDDLQGLNAYLVLAGKALYRNQQAFAELMRDMFASARFDETERLREMISQMRAHRESGITQAGHRLAMQAASAGSSPYAQLTHRWDGLLGIRNIIALDNALKDDQQLSALAARFKKIQALILQAPRQFLLVNDDENIDDISATLDGLWKNLPQSQSTSEFSVPFRQTPVSQAWITSTQVNFCAKSYRAVPYGHADAAPLTVLGNFLRNGFLHRTIREQGGAYGGGAAYAADTGTFRFYSYRDPRFADTLRDFDRSLEWLQNGAHDQRQLEEAILGVISDIDRPDSPAGEAAGTWFASLHGRTPARRREFRRRVMDVTLADLQRVAREYLNPAAANIAVITNNTSLEQHNKANPDLTLEACLLK